MNRITQTNNAPTQASPTTIPVAFAEEPVVTFNCFEPNSMQLHLTEEDLVRHTLFVGTTGSGKTTTMNRMLCDLIHYRASLPAEKLGLLVVDSKRDDTVAKVRAWAAAAGRADDVVVLEPGSSHGYDPLLELESLRDLDSVCAKIRSAARPMHSTDGYWMDSVERMLDAALTILFATSKRVTFVESMEFFGQLLMNARDMDASARTRLDQFQDLVTLLAAKADPQWPVSAQLKLQGAQTEISNWRGSSFDERTRSTITSCIANVLKPLRSTVAHDYFAVDGRMVFDLNGIVQDGKILVVSVDAAGNPEVAQTLIKLVKADYFRILQGRRLGSRSKARLAGVVLDEYPLAVTAGEGRYSDSTQLQTLRSKRGFLVAATQGFISLDMVVGERSRDALLANFNNLFFLNSHEWQVQAFVQPFFGQKTSAAKASMKVDTNDAEGTGNVATTRQSVELEYQDWVCKPGTLSTLETGQAFVALACGGKFKHPLWLEPLYFDAPEPAQPVSLRTDDPTAIIRREFARIKRGATPEESPWTRDQRMIREEQVKIFEGMAALPSAEDPAANNAAAEPDELNEKETHIEILVTEAELDELLSKPGVLGRLAELDFAFKCSVRVKANPDVPKTGEDQLLLLAWSQLHKLGTVPPQTKADHALLAALKAIGICTGDSNAGEDVPF